MIDAGEIADLKTVAAVSARLAPECFLKVGLVWQPSVVDSTPHPSSLFSPSPRSRWPAPSPEIRAAREETKRAGACAAGCARQGRLLAGRDRRASGRVRPRALDAFKAAHGLAGASGAIDQATITALGDAYGNPLTKYTITAADVEGPFEEQIPQDMIEKAKLKTLGYTSALEELAERFHAKPDLLTRLNPNAQLAAGTTITVPAVDPMQIPTRQGERPQLRRRTRRPDRDHERERRGGGEDAKGAILLRR